MGEKTKTKENETWLRTIIADSDWQETDPTSRQRGRPTKTTHEIQTELISGRKSQGGLDAKTYWPSAVTWPQTSDLRPQTFILSQNSHLCHEVLTEQVDQFKNVL
jgi:hypothetical protein